MKKIYVAGPYSDTNVLGVLKNIGRGTEYASKLFMNGFAPFTPWHDANFVIQNWRDNFTVKNFYDYSMEWLKCSDALFVVPDHEGLRDWGDSYGTVKEIEEAERLGIPVFYDLESLKKWRDKKVI